MKKQYIILGLVLLALSLTIHAEEDGGYAGAFLKLMDEKILVHEECIAITKTGYKLLTIRAPKTYFNIEVL